MKNKVYIPGVSLTPLFVEKMIAKRHARAGIVSHAESVVLESPHAAKIIHAGGVCIRRIERCLEKEVEPLYLSSDALCAEYYQLLPPAAAAEDRIAARYLDNCAARRVKIIAALSEINAAIISKTNEAEDQEQQILYVVLRHIEAYSEGVSLGLGKPIERDSDVGSKPQGKLVKEFKLRHAPQDMTRSRVLESIIPKEVENNEIPVEET